MWGAGAAGDAVYTTASVTRDWAGVAMQNPKQPKDEVKEEGGEGRMEHNMFKETAPTVNSRKKMGK